MSGETLILVAIALLFAANFWAKYMEVDRDKKIAELQRLAVVRMKRIDAMLVCWAQHWGEPPEKVKAKLIEILNGELK